MTTIVFRYLAREVFAATTVVALVLLAISLGGRAVSYMRDAALGLLSSDVLMTLMVYRIPGLLEIIMPVAFFVGVMLGFGRLYLDSEMIILESVGFGPQRLLRITLGFSLVVAALVAALSLYVRPWSQAQIEAIATRQASLSEFDLIIPGQFQSMTEGRRVTYTEELDRETAAMSHVFVVEERDSKSSPKKKVDVTLAEAGHHRIETVNGNSFLVLENGVRYTGRPGDADYQVIRYRELGQLIERQQSQRGPRRTSLPTGQLMASTDLNYRSEFQWRISIVILVPIVGMLAVPLCRTNARQGRFAKLLPGMVLIFLYLMLLSISRSAVAKAQLPPAIGLYWVHGFFLVLAVALYWLKPGYETSLWQPGEQVEEP